ncbi:MAG: hypothetical protein AAGB00_12210 [Planctomycetota bacterium]
MKRPQRVVTRPFVLGPFLLGRLLSAVLASLLIPSAYSAPPIDTVFPGEAVAFFSIADAGGFETKWEQTQVGQFTSDASLEPFVKKIRAQIIDRFGNIDQRLGMSLDDVTAAAGGEVGVGMVHREGERASIVVVIDTTGKQAEADELIVKTEAQLAKRGATRRSETHAGVELTVLNLPATPRRPKPRDIVRFRVGALLCAVDSVPYAKQVIDTAAGDAAPLARRRPYAETMRRCEAESRGVAADVRWYIAPFGWDLARRTLHEQPMLADRKDTITILREQGFDAIRGVGGHVSLAVTPQQDIVHRTAIYAPGEPGTDGQPASKKYRLGMRMAELPNRPDMPVEPWAPRMTATYTTVNLDILNVFDNVATVFDAMSGYDGAFRHTLDSFEIDPYGPEIKVRDELIKNLGTRVTMMTDYKLPITTDCERYLIVAEVKNPQGLRVPVDKLMENDGAARKQVNGVEYWEILPEDETLTNADLPDDLLSIDDTPAEAEADDNPRVLRRAAVCLHGGQLIVASDVEFLRQVLFGVTTRESLAGTLDFQAAMEQLGQLASTERCSWSFFRTDESIRPSYELVRQGLMPQSQTFFGRLLNEMLTTQAEEKEGIVRKQRVDGTQMPSFEVARRYFGPAARAIRTDADGWFITGVVLSKAGQ